MDKRLGFFSYWLSEAKEVIKRDPAIDSLFIALFFHPGTKAKVYHRISSFFFRHDWKRLALMLSYRARRITGIEIHPGAKIGDRLLIDHGMGIVIGETAVIGDDCTIFHGVTLGGVRNTPGTKRHPTIGNHVLVGAESVILGPITVGAGARIGAQAVVLDSVPAYTTAVGHPAKVVKKRTPAI